MKLKTLYRNIAVRAEDVDTEKRTLNISFSSEEPVERWFGSEILDHKESSVDFSRLNDGAPFLVNHDGDQLVGVVEKAIIKELKGHAMIRFGKSDFAQEIMDDINDGIRKNISFGYKINKMVLEKESKEETIYRATSWMPFEISTVPVPADNTVGVGRNKDIEYEVEIEKPEKKEATEPKKEEENEPEEKKFVKSLEFRKRELSLHEHSI